MHLPYKHQQSKIKDGKDDEVPQGRRKVKVKQWLVVEAEIDHEKSDEDVLNHDDDERRDGILVHGVLKVSDAIVGEDCREEDENGDRYDKA